LIQNALLLALASLVHPRVNFCQEPKPYLLKLDGAVINLVSDDKASLNQDTSISYDVYADFNPAEAADPSQDPGSKGSKKKHLQLDNARTWGGALSSQFGRAYRPPYYAMLIRKGSQFLNGEFTGDTNKCTLSVDRTSERFEFTVDKQGVLQQNLVLPFMRTLLGTPSLTIRLPECKFFGTTYHDGVVLEGRSDSLPISIEFPTPAKEGTEPFTRLSDTFAKVRVVPDLHDVLPAEDKKALDSVSAWADRHQYRFYLSGAFFSADADARDTNEFTLKFTFRRPEAEGDQLKIQFGNP